MTNALTIDVYAFVTLLIAVLILGIFVGMIGSPIYTARRDRRRALSLLRRNWRTQ